MNLEEFENRLVIMRDRIFEDLQVVRATVMYGHGGSEWEKALQKYDELAIRYDQMKKVFEELEISQLIDRVAEA